MNGMMPDLDTWPYRRPVKLNRFLFATRTPLALPDGFFYSGTMHAVGTGNSTDDINWVSMTVHQVAGGPNQSLRAAAAVMGVAGRAKKPTTDEAGRQPNDLLETWSVVEVITPHQADPVSRQEGPAHARHWTEDSIMRAVFALQHIARAERLSSASTNAIPTYEHVMTPIHAQYGTGEELLEAEAPDSRVLATKHPDVWGSPQLVWLEHGNLAMDSVQIRSGVSQEDPVLRKWLVDLEFGLPAALWRERLQDARQQLQVEGRYDLAVILFSTATEVLLDGLLQMLWWEKSIQGSEINASMVANDFDRTRDALDRMNKFLVPMLGGNWSAADGAVQTWRRLTYNLRHKCVHGGYYPTASEAIAASTASDEVATFLFDRIGEARNSFPRTCLMTLAQSGLQTRNQWDGQIRRFAEHEAQREGNWSFALKAFRDKVNSLRNV